MNLLSSRRRASAVAVALAFGLVACGRSGSDVATDTAAGTLAGDSHVAGMDHSMMGAPDRPAPRDADQEFLRMMSDHHEGLIEMASAAVTGGSSSEIKADARRLKETQEREQKQMMDMLRNAYGEELQPHMMPGNMAMHDSLQPHLGDAYDRTFYEMVVKHHREGIRMMDDFGPRVRRPEVKRMLEEMRANQLRDIGDLEEKPR
ncbi:MAG TPA: DUF305 domain-containing protein [Gemmatimonadaceae bacterium]|nr:DUF305 domain-containing protein [Gemmatimonadaceae bacterium]